VHNLVRGLSPFPGAFIEIETGGKAERLKILRTAIASGSGAPGMVVDDRLTVACATDAVRLIEVQRAGKRPMSAEEFLRGFPIQRGMRIGRAG
jgi:methionyl-tRNA formyltransferase